ncbi:hypothetical protein UT300001_11630 [Clostridium sp. CTA-1]
MKKYIVEDNQNFPEIDDYKKAKKWIKDNCYFLYVEVQDFRERGHVEGLLVFLFDSRYMEEEH